MESQPENPEFRINPENFQPCIYETMLHFDECRLRQACAGFLLILETQNAVPSVG